MWILSDSHPRNTETGRRIVSNVLTISYETFRLYTNILRKKPIGLVICDEVCNWLK